jgi:hypothetical protein
MELDQRQARAVGIESMGMGDLVRFVTETQEGKMISLRQWIDMAAVRREIRRERIERAVKRVVVIGSVLGVFVLLVVLLSGCIPDIGAECKRVLDRERASIAKEVGEQCSTQIVQAVGLFFDVRLAMYGCTLTDAGLWNCRETLLCGAGK